MNPIIRAIRENPRQVRHTIVPLIFLFSLLVLASLGLFLQDASITGLGVYEEAISQNIFDTFNKTEVILLNLPDRITSFSISGALSPNGEINIYLRDNVTTLKVADNSQTWLDHYCLETCTVTNLSEDVVLVIEIQNSTASIDDITYTILKENNLPRYTALRKEFVVQKNRNFSINLSNYVQDIDKDDLTFILTDRDHMEGVVANNILTFTPETDFIGEINTTLIVSDGKEIERINLTFKVTYEADEAANYPSYVDSEIIRELEVLLTARTNVDQGRFFQLQDHWLICLNLL